MAQTCFCPVKGVIDLVGKKWVLLIVNTLGNFKVQRFGDLEKRLKGISPKTLSDTLTRLQDEGLVIRESYNEIPPRVEYRLSEDGQEFREVIQPLIQWAAKRDGWDHNKCPSCADHHGSDSCYCNHR
jgi:DNA-binding HxlR family transcriptional regulator